MGNIVLYYGTSKELKRIVHKYQEMYQASLYEIETIKKVTFFDKFKSVYSNLNIPIKRCQLNLSNYKTVILVTELWYDRVPLPVLRFLEQQTGNIKNVMYI